MCHGTIGASWEFAVAVHIEDPVTSHDTKPITGQSSHHGTWPETGYRIPLKCALVKAKTKELNAKNPQNNQSTTENNETYITYRSCIPAVSEDKLSVLGFEGIILGMLAISGSFLYYRKKQTAAMSASGAIRIPTSSRF
ncbi:unnamed protein product [Rhodiola kirilowii]